MRNRILEKRGWLSQKDLVTKAFGAKGAVLDDPVAGAQYYRSKPIFSLEMTDDIIDAFEQSGFEFLPPETEGGKGCLLFRFSAARAFRWELARGEKINLTLSTYDFADYRDGVWLEPSIGGITCELPGDNKPGLIAFRIAAACRMDAPRSVKDFVACDELLVPWSEMGLEGIKSVFRLWAESVDDYPSRRYLAGFGIIKPDPAPALDDFTMPAFVPRGIQINLLTFWEKQIMDFAEGLHK